MCAVSIQTDCEILAVEAMEAYAEKYNISGEEVAELFHKNQVFENVDSARISSSS